MTDANFNVGCTGLGWYTTKDGQKVRTTSGATRRRATGKGMRTADGLCQFCR